MSAISEPDYNPEVPVPYTVEAEIEGVADLLFHRWSCDAVEAKSAAAKNSRQKKTDDLESYVYRTDSGRLGIPGEYVRQAILAAAKFRADPRSPRKSARDLFNAGIVALTPLADTGKKTWDFEDRRRVVIQRSGVTRTRPALKSGWSVKVHFAVLLPEYITFHDFAETIATAGRLIGIGDFRPTYGRFLIRKIKQL